MFSVFIVFVIEISYCDSTGFQMTYRHNRVSGGVHYMRAGETLAFHLRTECRAWGSIPLDYSWFSMWRPSLSVMTWLSCLNHLKNRTVCLSGWNSSPVSEFLAVKLDFFFLPLLVSQLYGAELFSLYSLVAQPHNMQWSPEHSFQTMSMEVFGKRWHTGSPQSIIGDLVKWNLFINSDIVILMTCMCFSIGMCLNTRVQL